MNDVKLLTGGQVVQARSAATFGRRNPVSGADAFTEMRWFTLQTAPRHYPF
jgi:hypothetical protein